MSITDFEKKEQQQSHTLLLLANGNAYTCLGWRKYREFNRDITSAIKSLEKESNIKIYIFEHEIIDIERLFIFGVSFIEPISEKNKSLSEKILKSLNEILIDYPELNDCSPVNSSLHPSIFKRLGLEISRFYIDLVMNADLELNSSYSPPSEKSYIKNDLNLDDFKNAMTISDFRRMINQHLKTNSTDDLSYIFAPDGYHSNKYRSNKYLREEFVPLLNFITKNNIPDDSEIILGIQKENYDAKITTNGKENIIEITLGLPKHDHLLLSLMKDNIMGLPRLKTMSHLKKEIDSLPKKIVEAIEKKHHKNYEQNRTLIVVVQVEYTYQNEDYILQELLNEIRNNTYKGGFKEIVILFGSTLHKLF